MRKKIIQENHELSIGELTLPFTLVLSSQRKRTITLKVEKSGLVVSAPLKTPRIDLHNFIHKQKPWILRQFVAAQHRQASLNQQQFESGENLSFLGNSYVLCVKEAQRKKTSCQIVGEQLEVTVQENLDKEQRKQAVAGALFAWYRLQALPIVQERMQVWQEMLRVRPERLKITHALKRWGSCSSKNNICISWQIILLPLALLDYIVVHELCHIVHKNHSSRFWKLVATVMPDYKERDKALNQQQMLILS